MSRNYPSPFRGHSLLDLNIQSEGETLESSRCQSGKCNCAARLARLPRNRRRHSSMCSSVAPLEGTQSDTESQRRDLSWIHKSRPYESDSLFDQVAVLKSPLDPANHHHSHNTSSRHSNKTQPSHRTDSIFEQSGSERRMKKFPFVRCRKHMRSHSTGDDENSLAFGNATAPDSLADETVTRSVPTLHSRNRASGVTGLWSESKTGSVKSVASNGDIFENENSDQVYSMGGTRYRQLAQRVAVNPIIRSNTPPVRHRLRVQNQIWPTFPKEKTEESSSEDEDNEDDEAEAEDKTDPEDEALYRKIFAGCKTKDEIAKELRPNRFLLYYLKSKNVRVAAPLQLGYMSQAGVTFHFPVLCSKVESARERRWSWKVDSGESTDDQPTFSTLSALARYYKTNTYWEAVNRSSEAFPIWNEKTKKFAHQP